MFGNLSGAHFLILLLVILLIFGAPKLPGLAKSIGQSMKILKKEVREMSADDTPRVQQDEQAASAASAVIEKSDSTKPDEPLVADK